jgi:hypothetical protein
MDPRYVKGLREAKAQVDAGTLTPEEFEKEKKRLLALREEREKEALAADQRLQKRPLEEGASSTPKRKASAVGEGDQALLSEFRGGGLGGRAGIGKDGLAAAKKMQLDRLDVSGTGGAGNIAVFQVALTRLSEGAKNACRVALTDENPFEQSFGLSAQLQLARKDALTRSEYNPTKSPSPTFEAFGNYMAIVFAILTADAKHRANNTAANLHRKQAAAFPEGWRALVARVERANWAGANSPAALSCFVRVVMGDIPSGGERKVRRGAGLGRLMTCPGASAR